MCDSKTMEELMKDISSLANGIEWNNGEPKGVICISYDKGDVMCNAYGNSRCVISAIASMMICDKEVREIMHSAFKAYSEYNAKHISGSIGPLIQQVENIQRQALHAEQQDYAPCVFDCKFRPKS